MPALPTPVVTPTISAPVEPALRRDAAADYLELLCDEDEEPACEASSSTEPRPVELPSAERFAGFDARDQTTLLSSALVLMDRWSDLPTVCERAGVETRTRRVDRWSSEERCAVYGEVLRRPTGPPPLVALG